VNLRGKPINRFRSLVARSGRQDRERADVTRLRALRDAERLAAFEPRIPDGNTLSRRAPYWIRPS